MPTPPLPSRDDDEHVAHGEGDGFRYYAMLYRVACDVEMGANGPTVADPIRTATGALQGMLHEAVARAATAKMAADLMRARAERAERFLSMLFDSHWDGTIGRPPTWRLRGDFRHILAGLRGETLAEAIAALSTQRGEGGS